MAEGGPAGNAASPTSGPRSRREGWLAGAARRGAPVDPLAGRPDGGGDPVAGPARGGGVAGATASSGRSPSAIAAARTSRSCALEPLRPAGEQRAQLLVAARWRPGAAA